METGTNPTVNTFHGDKWKVVLSNIPSLTNMTEMGLYNYFIKSVEIPEYNQEYVPSSFKGSQVLHPVSQNNDVLNSITIEFKLSENMENYYNLLTWMQTIRYGQPRGTPSMKELIRKNTVKSIDILFLDNQKRTQKKMQFTEAVLIGLSTLPLVMGDSSEITFSTTWQYQEVLMTDE